MKLYKIDFTNTIGDYVVTVPTDSQFLLGISNGDSEADVELLDGETELTPEEDKIGAYTVFNFETDGTPFRKHLIANINGQKPVTKYWDAHEYDLVNGEDTSTIAILDGDVFAELKTEPNIHAEFDGDDTLTVKFKDASGNYSTTLTYTYENALVASGIACTVWNAPEEIDEEISSTYLIPKKIRLKNVQTIWGWNKIEPNYTGQSSSVNWKATPLVADIQIPYQGTESYTDKLNIVVKCDKMSVAYRDIDTGVLAEEVVELVEESGVFQTALKPLTLETPASNLSIDIDDTNFMDVERTIYEIGTTDAQVTSKTITVNIDLADFPVETGSTQMFKLNLKINCLGDAVTLPDGLISINTTDGDLSTSDFYASYISGPTSLATVIGDSSGTSLLVELVFNADGGYAFIKGASYIE